MKRLPRALLTFSVSVALIASPCFAAQATSQSRKVGVFLFAQHPVIAEIAAGFKKELEAMAAQKGVAIQYIERNADGQPPQAQAVARFFAAGDADAVFVVGLPAAQALKTVGITKPVVFGGVPDPVAAGLLPRLSGHQTNFTGSKYLPDAAGNLEVFLGAFPKAKRVAILANPGEPNSVAVVKVFEAAAKGRGIKVRNLAVSDAPSLDAALRLLKSDAGGLFLPTDNFVYSNLDRIMARAGALKVPVFNCTKLVVEKGALFSLAADYGRVGALTAQVAAPIIFEGKAAADIDVLDVKEGTMFVSRTHPAAASLKVPAGYSKVLVP